MLLHLRQSLESQSRMVDAQVERSLGAPQHRASSPRRKPRHKPHAASLKPCVSDDAALRPATSHAASLKPRVSDDAALHLDGQQLTRSLPRAMRRDAAAAMVMLVEQLVSHADPLNFGDLQPYLPHALVTATYSHNWRLMAEAMGRVGESIDNDEFDPMSSMSGMDNPAVAF